MDRRCSLVIGFSLISLMLLVGVTRNPTYGLSEPPSPITVEGCGPHSTRGYSVDWDYQLVIGERVSDNIVIKNKHAEQDKVNSDSECNITVAINCCSGENDLVVNSMSAFMSSGKIKVSDHAIKFEKIIKLKQRFLDRIELGLKLPKLKSGTYNFIVKVTNNDELQSLFITKIKIFKPENVPNQ